MYIKSALGRSESIVMNRAFSQHGEENLNEWHDFARYYPNLTVYGKYAATLISCRPGTAVDEGIKREINGDSRSFYQI